MSENPRFTQTKLMVSTAYEASHGIFWGWTEHEQMKTIWCQQMEPLMEKFQSNFIISNDFAVHRSSFIIQIA